VQVLLILRAVLLPLGPLGVGLVELRLHGVRAPLQEGGDRFVQDQVQQEIQHEEVDDVDGDVNGLDVHETTL